MERLDQGHLHPKLTCPGRESNTAPRWEASTLDKNHTNSLLTAVRNIYSTYELIYYSLHCSGAGRRADPRRRTIQRRRRKSRPQRTSCSGTGRTRTSSSRTRRKRRRRRKEERPWEQRIRSSCRGGHCLKPRGAVFVKNCWSILFEAVLRIRDILVRIQIRIRTSD
jgi:hypothetical protein